MKEPWASAGQRTVPVYARAKVTGTAKFAPDVNAPNLLWMKILRSPHPHARIIELDTSEAERLPGVDGVLTYRDVPRVRFADFPMRRATLRLTRWWTSLPIRLTWTP